MSILIVTQSYNLTQGEQNKAVYGGPLRKKWNKISEESRKRIFPVQPLCMFDIACLSFIPLYKHKFLQMLLVVPFIEIGGKEKITIASICDKKETL